MSATTLEETPIYFLWQGEKETGPFSLEELRAMRDSGKVDAQTLCACKGMDKWEMVADLFLRKQFEVYRPSPEEIENGGAFSLSLATCVSVLAGLAVLLTLLAATGWRDSRPRAEHHQTGYGPGWLRLNMPVTVVRAHFMDRGDAELWTAYRTGTNFIAAHLSAPATARFASFKDCEFAGSYPLSVKFFADSQNGFGALGRAHYQLLMDPQSDKGWSIVAMKTWSNDGEVYDWSYKFTNDVKTGEAFPAVERRLTDAGPPMR